VASQRLTVSLTQCDYRRSYLGHSATTRSGPSIGFGGSSTVSCEKDAETGETVAVKRFYSVNFNAPEFLREIEVLAQLNHPCVLRIRGWTPPIGREPAEIRTEIAETGSLMGILEKVRCGTQFSFWNPTGKAILICGIALGMRFVHSKGIIHGDLKPSNVLLNARGEPLISDFGSSRFESNDYTLTPGGGTVNYAAPELFTEGATHTRQVDVYAFGLLMYEILTGAAAFPSTDFPFPILKRILRGQMPEVPDEGGSFMQELIPRCWSLAPEKRPRVDEIIREFRAAEFRIVPQADAVMVGMYVGDIEMWEAKESAPSRSH
jgi:abelson tyrosine-protein kinase 1/abelson tyrosine-protein kinase 2